jgi:predicted DNA-binding transcriptional regulator AlpA
MKRNEFPMPVRIGARSVAWTSGSIAEWQEARIQAFKSA